MASSISVDGSTFNFIVLRGEPEPVGLELEVVSRPGVNGHAYWEDAKRGRPFEMEGMIDFTSHALAETTFASLKAKQGKVATAVVDDRNKSWSNVVILSVEKVANRPIRGNVGGKVVDGTAVALL